MNRTRSRAAFSAPSNQQASDSDALDLIFIPSANVKDGHIFRPWVSCLEKNKSKWQEKAVEGSSSFSILFSLNRPSCWHRLMAGGQMVISLMIDNHHYQWWLVRKATNRFNLLNLLSQMPDSVLWRETVVLMKVQSKLVQSSDGDVSSFWFKTDLEVTVLVIAHMVLTETVLLELALVRIYQGNLWKSNFIWDGYIGLSELANRLVANS